MISKELLQLGAKLEMARRDFHYYCRLTASDFYTKDRKFLGDICNEMQNFLVSEDDVLIINAPPRHGKSRTACKLVEWVLGRDKTKKIMTGSFNETLSTVFSKNVRNNIQEIKADKDKIVYSDIFPGVEIKHGDGAMNLWSLEGGYNNYLATSPTGTATGFGCDLMVIDDLIKNALTAYNEAALEGMWVWFVDTMLSRLEEGGKIIIIMTRWATDDLAGKAMEYFAEEGMRIRHMTLKAVQEDGTMLCPEILSKESYALKVHAMSAEIASANYQQEPLNIVGRLYNSFKTYDKLPVDKDGKSLFTSIKAYIDSADEGDDYLAAGIYGEYNNEAYMLDVLYTNKSMEWTEPELARMLDYWKVNVAKFESNNGGRGFARAVARILAEKYKSNHTRCTVFYQSKNKVARILSNATWVMDHVYMPNNWKDKWKEYHMAMIKYQRQGKNAHDDGPDMTTGIAEQFNTSKAGFINLTS